MGAPGLLFDDVEVLPESYFGAHRVELAPGCGGCRRGRQLAKPVVEELVAAGIKDIVIVGSQNKRSIEDHFDLPSEELLASLRAGGEKKKHYIDEIEAIASLANFVYIRQKGPYGNATPLSCAAHLIGDDEPFIYAFADEFIVAEPSRFEQMLAVSKKYDGEVLSCKRIIDDSGYDRYGIVAGETVDDGVIQISHIVEKPGKAAAPSNLASVSSYLLSGKFFPYLDAAKEKYDGKGEFMLQPIIQEMINEGHHYYACEIKNGTYYDTGDKLEYLKTVIDFGLANEELGPALREHLKKRLTQ